MAKANYRFEKRQRELKKQQKKQEKDKRKAEMKGSTESTPPESKTADVDTVPVE